MNLFLRRHCFSCIRRKYNDFPKGCGWEEVIGKAKCIKEAERLDHTEECGICDPLPEINIDAVEDVPNLRPINGAPCEAYTRNTAVIQKNTKSPMQSGTANTQSYVLSFMKDITWENPLLGWASGSNSVKDIEIHFPSIESAKLYAERNGWDFYTPPEISQKKFHKKDYGQNFSWNKRTRTSTK